MADAVMERLDGNDHPSNILDAAHNSNEYEHIPLDCCRYQVYRGPRRLVIGIQGQGVYVEETTMENREDSCCFVEQYLDSQIERQSQTDLPKGNTQSTEDRYEFYETDEGTVIFDSRKPLAWIKSENSKDLQEMR